MTSNPIIASIADALAHLRARCPALLDDLAKADRVLWVGSGVSLGQVPGLDVLLRRVLTFLQNGIDGSAAGIACQAALDEIVEQYLAGDLAAFRSDPINWAIPDDLSELVTSYSKILSAEVGKHPQDYLLWDAVDVRETYGSPAIEPGPEHRLIAYLIHEGVVEEVVTTNWDGLIERAVEESAGSGQMPLLGVLMTNESFRTARGKSKLLKQHGCAVLAREDEVYRKYLVAQTLDIAMWLNSPLYARMVGEVRAVAKDRRSLMLGFSAQDYNVLVQIAAASQDIEWTWDPSDPAYFFAEPKISSSQRKVLSAVYGDNYPPNRPEICGASVAGMYSGPLLGAAVLHVVIEKFKIGLEHAAAFAVSAQVVADLGDGLTRLETHIADDAHDDLDRLVELLRSGVSSLVRRFFSPGKELTSAEYVPVHGQSLKAGVGDDFRNLRMPELAVALGLLGLGYEQDLWTLSVGTESDGHSGVIELTPVKATTARPSKVVITKDWGATNSLKGTDLWTSEPGDVLVIQATGEAAKVLSRGLGRGIGSGRKARPSRRSVWLSDLEPFAADPVELMAAFRAEVSA